MQELILEYFWQLFFLMACAWYFGFVSGKWWALLDKEEMPDSDEMWRRLITAASPRRCLILGRSYP